MDFKISAPWLRNVSIVVASTVLARPAFAELPKYQMLDLGTFEALGGYESHGVAINNHGEVAGDYSWREFVPGPNGSIRPFLYSNGVMVDLGWPFSGLGENNGRSAAINDIGQVAGGGQTGVIFGYGSFLYSKSSGILDVFGISAGSSNIGAHDINGAGQVTGTLGYILGAGFNSAYLYSDGTLSNLGTLGGERSSGSGINDLGHVTGEATTADGFGHAFLYAHGAMGDLGTLGGGYSAGVAINQFDQVVGYSAHSDGSYHAFKYADGNMIDLGTFGGEFSWSSDINDSGQVAGYAMTPDGDYHAFLYNDGLLADLGTLGGDESYAYAINAVGEITGEAFLPDGTYHAFVYSKGVITDLGTLGGQFSFGLDINDVGQVTGTAEAAGGVKHAFRATPIALLFNRLLNSVIGVGPGKSFANKVRLATAHYNDDAGPATCGTLQSFIEQLAGLAGKKKIGKATAMKLTGDAREIKAAVGCN